MDNLIICGLVLLHESTWSPSSTSSTHDLSYLFNQHLITALWQSSIVAYLKSCDAKAVAEWAGGDATEGEREAEFWKKDECDVHYRMERRLL
jgi:hypothetical protein